MNRSRLIDWVLKVIFLTLLALYMIPHVAKIYYLVGAMLSSDCYVVDSDGWTHRFGCPD